MSGLLSFIAESNRIEGILRDPLQSEIDAHNRLLDLEQIGVADMERFVSAIAPGHVLRRRAGLDVRVGNHIAPPGGPEIETALLSILGRAVFGYIDKAHEIHVAYEILHPFTDGNGRSGRALWLWMMGGSSRIGFLHRFYYQTLENAR